METKQRNRSVVPFINSKLPSGSDALARRIDQMLHSTGGWHFNSKTRLVPGDAGFDQYNSLGEMLDALKSGGDVTGGGAVSRIFSLQELGELDLDWQFYDSVRLFAPLLSRCAPTPWDIEIRVAQEQVGEMQAFDELPPVSDEEGRLRVLTEVARRQGQARFRSKLLEAYGGACAISATDVPDTLQAAHIRPYTGLSTNTVSNGLLLRADLHTLFDLKLITIDPSSLCVLASPRLKGTDYWQFHGRALRLPEKRSERPASSALEWHFRLAVKEKTGTALEFDITGGD